MVTAITCTTGNSSLGWLMGSGASSTTSTAAAATGKNDSGSSHSSSTSDNGSDRQRERQINVAPAPATIAEATKIDGKSIAGDVTSEVAKEVSIELLQNDT